MTANSIDILIKKIYNSYLDLKFEELDSSKKEILLNDINSFYSEVKDFNIESKVNTDTLSKSNDFSFDENSKKSEASIIEFEPKVNNEQATNTMSETNTELDKEMLSFDFGKLNEETSEINVLEKTEVVSNNILASPNPITNNNVSNDQFVPNIDIENIEPSNTNANKIEYNEEHRYSSKQIQDLLSKDQIATKEIYDLLDLNTRIGLVEQFFNGNSVELSECLMKMNMSKTKNKYLEYLELYRQKNNVSKESEIYETFLELINRSFDK